MSRIRANNIVNGAGTGAPTFPNGAVINGISTITADVTLNTAQLNGTDADFSGIGTYGVVSLGTGTSISSPSDNVLVLGTNDTEALRITANGDTQVSSGSSLYIANGNLVFSTSGTGIDFQSVGVSSTTATSHILDDYEEGTWTPEYTCSTTAPTITYNIQIGVYTKVGNLVTVGWRLRTTGPIASAGTGDVYVTNLPFVIGNTDFDQRGVAQIWSSNWAAGLNPTACTGRKGEATAQLSLQTTTNSSANNLNGDFNNIAETAFDTSSGAHNQSYCTLTYFVD
jgi:hypothetical protein